MGISKNADTNSRGKTVHVVILKILRIWHEGSQGSNKMSDWWERLGSNYESGQEKQNDHNEGQKAGSEATSVDKIAHNIGGSGRSEQYDEGWTNGVNNPSSG